MNSFDVVIIGSGLGGLVAGAKLSKEGKKVLIFEQHSIAGGCSTTFRRKDFTIEVGLHEIDGLDREDPKMKIFMDLGINENIEFLRVPEFYRFVNKNTDIIIPDNIKESITILSDKFPLEKAGIVKFFNRIVAIQKETTKFLDDKRNKKMILPLIPFIYPNLFLNKNRCLGNFLDSIIKNEELKLILQANLLYYHDDSYSMSLIYFSAGQASYFKGGAYYIRGGSKKLSDYLVNYIQERGGSVLLNHMVTDIVIEDGIAKGVKYYQKKDVLKEQKILYGDIVVCNAAIPNLKSLIKDNLHNSLLTKIEKSVNACSLLTIYIGFKSDIRTFGCIHYSSIFFNESVTSQRKIKRNNLGNIETRNFIFVNYSVIDSKLAPEGKSIGSICVVDYLREWEKLSETEYQKKKEEVAQSYFARLESYFPGISNEIEYYEVGTSKTIKKYTLNPGGSVYGFAQTPGQTGLMRLRHRSKYKNLYFASAWVSPGGGFTGAILSGWYCARDVLKDLN